MAFNHDLVTDAIVVRELPLNDNDKSLTIITEKNGKMFVIAKGIKAVNSKRSAGAHLFCLSSFSFIERSNDYGKPKLYLDEIVVKNNFQNLGKDVASVALASYFAEYASFVCQENNDESKMLRLLCNCYHALANTDNPKWMIKAAFEVKSMEILGFMPNFEQCCVCGSPLERSFQSRIFEPVQGGFVCEKCMANEGFEASQDSSVFSREMFDAMMHICGNDQRKMLQFRLSPKYIKRFCAACERYSIVQNEKSFRSLDYYNKNFNT